MSEEMMIGADFVHLLRKLAHDMRTPLGTVISTADMLEKGIYEPLQTKQTRANERIQRSSRRSLAILDDFVTYIRAVTDDLIINTIPFNPAIILTQWEQKFAVDAQAKNLELSFLHTSSYPENVVGDMAMFQQAVLPLWANALSFTEQGFIRIESQWSDHNEWIILVTNSGTMISFDESSHVFTPFWRGEHRFVTSTASAGLGLSVSRALARLMSGDVELIQSDSSQTTFQIKVPFVNVP